MPHINRILDYLIANRSRIQRLSKEGGWIVLGQVAVVVGSLVLVRVLTEYLTPEQYGELALGLTVALLVNQVVMGGVVSGIGRYYSIAFEKKDLGGYLQASFRLLGYSVLAVIGIGIALVFGLSWLGHDQWLGLAIAGMIFAVLSGCNSTLSGIQNAARQRAIVAFHRGLEAWLKIGLAVAVLVWMGTSSTAVVLGYIGATLLVTFSQLFFLRRTIPSARFDEQIQHRDWVRPIWTFSWPFSTWGIFTWAQQVSDRWALESFASTHEVGQYVVVYQLGYVPISMVTGLMASLIGPLLYQRSGEATDYMRNASVHRNSWRIAWASLAVSAGAFLFTWLFHTWLFQWLVAESFRGVSHFLPWVVLAGGLFAAGQMLSLKLMSEIRSHSLMPVKVGTALLGIMANILGAWWYGISGVVAALVFFSAVYVLWTMLLASRLPNRCTSASITK